MPTTIDQLRDAVAGPVRTPGDPGYDTVRGVYNAMIDRRPRVIVGARDQADVIAAVRFAADQRLDLAVRGGSHSVPGFGTCDDGVVCDLSAMRGVRVDPVNRVAHIDGGALLGDLDHATHAFGLATPVGFVSTTGVAGLALGGGIGAYLSRRFGLTCDNLLAADVVTADGHAVTATADAHPDLFWALRGGGGNLGVVTSLTLRLHPLEAIVGGPIFFEMAAAAEVMATYRDHMATAPRELGGFFAVQIAPPLPFIPEARHGDLLCAVVVCWSGDPGEADRVLKPVRDAGPVVAEHVGTIPYPALQSAFDGLVPAGLRHYWKADFLRGLPDEAIAAHLPHAARTPCLESTMHLYPLGGAIADVPVDATAFAHRDAAFAAVIAGMWPDAADDEANTAWVRAYYHAIHPHSGFEGGYSNFMAGDDAHRVRANYGAAYDRLAAVKRDWDPHNLFHLNQNVQP